MEKAQLARRSQASRSWWSQAAGITGQLRPTAARGYGGEAQPLRHRAQMRQRGGGSSRAARGVQSAAGEGCAMAAGVASEASRPNSAMAGQDSAPGRHRGCLVPTAPAIPPVALRGAEVTEGSEASAGY